MTAIYDRADQPPAPGALDDLDRELERLHTAVDGVAARLVAVLQPRAELLSSDRVDAPTPFRGRIDRLRELTARLERLAAEIDL